MFRPAASAQTSHDLANLAQEGVVESVDYDAGKVVVRVGEILTPPIDWLAPSGKTRLWCPPSEGEQVSVICPEGDFERAYVAGGLPSSSHPLLLLGEKVGVEFADAGRVIYDPAASVLAFELPGALTIAAPDGVSVSADAVIDGDVRITGDVQIDGRLRATGDVASDADVVADGISLKSHKHGQVASGSAKSGLPE